MPQLRSMPLPSLLFLPVKAMRLIDALSLTDQERVIAVIGAGGKTTFLYRLGNEMSANGGRVLLTTTTHMYCPPEKEADRCVLLSDLDTAQKYISGLSSSILRIFLAAEKVKGGKVRGIPPAWVEELKLSRLCRAIIVEADGAAGKPVKSYAGHEPNLPAGSDLVVVMAGIDALQGRLQEQDVHRAALAARIAEAPLGSPLTADILVKLIEQGAVKARIQAPRARLVAFFNKVDNPAALDKIQQPARRLVCHDFFERVIFGSCLSPEPVVKVLTGQYI